VTSLVSRSNQPNTNGWHRAFFQVDGRFGMSETDRSGGLMPCSNGTVGPSVIPQRAAQEPARRTAGRVDWYRLLALQQSHVGGLGALRPRRHVELDGLALIK